MLAWTEDPIVNSFIAQSGFATDQPPSDGSAWYRASEGIGCGGAEAGEATLECMREKPWEDVLGAIETRGVTPDLDGGFGPTVDDKIVFSDVTKRKKSGSFIQKVRQPPSLPPNTEISLS